MTENGLAARAVATDVLRAVLRKGEELEDAFERHPDLGSMEARDRGFARALIGTTLRRLGQIDALIAEALDRPTEPKAIVLDVLRLGAAQLLFMGTPAHAAVDSSVELAATRGADPYRGLINAVLRRLAREGERMVERQDAGRLNTPDWLWLSWRQAWGTARARAIVEAHLEEAPLDLTARDDPAAWVEPLDATLLPNGTLRRPAGGDLTALPGYADGVWWVQDLAASLPARLFGDVRGASVIDLCAAPGGKTAQLAAAGAGVTAIDRSARRLERLKANLERLRLEADVQVADAATWEPPAPVDAVLLDAPCSATGAARRHPDILRLKTPEDVAKLARAQGRLIARAVDLLKPDGILVYCTCSLQPDEGESRVERLLAADDRVRRDPITADEIGGLGEVLNERGEIRATPGMLRELGGIDGFFVARLRRTR